MKLPDKIYPPKPLWGGDWKMQGDPVLDKRGFILTIATLTELGQGRGTIYFRGQRVESHEVPRDQIADYLARIEASGPEGVAYVERYEALDIQSVESIPLRLRADPGQILPVGPWNGKPLQLLVDERKDQLLILDGEDFQIKSNIYGEGWEACYPGSGFEFAEQ